MTQFRLEPGMRIEDLKRQPFTIKEYEARNEAIISFENADKDNNGVLDEVEIQSFEKKTKTCDKLYKMADLELVTAPGFFVSLVVALNSATKGMRRGFGIASAVFGLLSAAPLVARAIDPRQEH